MQQSLFDQKGLSQPLADRLRPQTLEDYVGQEHLLGAAPPDIGGLCGAGASSGAREGAAADDRAG